MNIIELKNVSYTYKTQYNETPALQGVTLSFETGKLYAVTGPSGSGKSTLLSMIAGLDIPTQGEVITAGVSTSKTNLTTYRRKAVSVIYQNFKLFPLLTACENVMYPMELNGMNAKAAKENAVKLLDQVGLGSDTVDKFPAMLSGGQQQRVAIARALGMNTNILLADEPTGNLDSVNTENIFRILCDLAHKANYCVIMVTHDPELSSRADEVITLKDGMLVK